MRTRKKHSNKSYSGTGLRATAFRWILLLLLSGNITGVCRAAIVDTISISSKAMHQSFRCVVILPDTYKRTRVAKQAFPVVYLLHGWSGNFSNWIRKVPQLKNYADQYGLIIICPEGGYSSWYLDSPVDSAVRYASYIGWEVPAYIDSHYRTIRNRNGRAITGLSMGGHGALSLALQRADFFGACGSMSGVVDLNSSRTKYDLSKRLGDTIHYAENWDRYSVMYMIDQFPKDSLAMIIDCGTGDGFYPVNHALHEKLLRLNIPHDYIERPGKHDWAYWANAVKYQLLFFRNFFDARSK